MTNSEILGPDERECLRHYEDLAERMPREEAAEFVARVQEAAGRVFGGLDKVLVVGAGSFRRGKATCGDVDVLITSQDFSTSLLDIKVLLAELHRTGLLVPRARWDRLVLGCARTNAVNKGSRSLARVGAHVPVQVALL